jgi:hypothetical protein
MKMELQQHHKISIGGYDGSAGSPVSVARYWLYKFDSLSNAYANWTQFITAPLRVGLDIP